MRYVYVLFIITLLSAQQIRPALVSEGTVCSLLVALDASRGLDVALAAKLSRPELFSRRGGEGEKEREIEVVYVMYDPM